MTPRFESPKHFTDLDLQLWQLEGAAHGRATVGSRHALMAGGEGVFEAIASSIDGLLASFGRGNRRYCCNPPAPLPAGVRLRWLEELHLRVAEAASEAGDFSLEGGTFAIALPPKAAGWLAEQLRGLAGTAGLGDREREPAELRDGTRPRTR